MSKATRALVIVGLVIAAGPAIGRLTKLVEVLPPLIVVCGGVAVAWQIASYLTNR
jgi:hypothetical protein